MNQSIQVAINSQINAEIESAHIYLSMAAYLDSIALPGCASWMKIQHSEEMEHAMKFYDFLYDRGGKAELQSIAAPQANFDSVLAVFEKALENEKKVTKLIHDLYELAKQEKDYAFESFLKWFIDEQVEEEASATEVIDKIKMIGDHGPALIMLDKELGQRK